MTMRRQTVTRTKDSVKRGSSCCSVKPGSVGNFSCLYRLLCLYSVTTDYRLNRFHINSTSTKLRLSSYILSQSGKDRSKRTNP